MESLLFVLANALGHEPASDKAGHVHPLSYSGGEGQGEEAVSHCCLAVPGDAQSPNPNRNLNRLMLPFRTADVVAASPRWRARAGPGDKAVPIMVRRW